MNPHQFQPQPQSQPPTSGSGSAKSRPSASCIPCRNRKVKCNRLHPCTTCLARNTPEECQYTATDMDRDAMKQAETIAALRRKLRGLNMAVSGVSPAAASASTTSVVSGSMSKTPMSESPETNAEEWEDCDDDDDDNEEMETVYVGLRDGQREVVDRIVGMVRGESSMQEVAWFVKQRLDPNPVIIDE